MTATPMAFDLVIFDWAGAVVDFGCCAPVSALVEAFGRRGVELDEAPARADMGKALRREGLKIASSTGYTREMMAPVLVHATEQGYVPDHLVCSGETPEGRPSPLMVYKASIWASGRCRA